MAGLRGLIDQASLITVKDLVVNLAVETVSEGKLLFFPPAQTLVFLGTSRNSWQIRPNPF